MPSIPSLQLEQIRRRRGVSLEEIANKSKISTRFLRAIETEEFDKLPGGVFDTNYIRQYAELVGCDADSVLEHYTAFLALRKQEQADAEAQVSRTRTRWGCRWINWLRGPSPATRASNGV